MSVVPPRPRHTGIGKLAAAGNKVHSGERIVPDAAQKTTVGFHATGLTNDRILFVAKVLVGYKVEVQVKDGTIHEGILHEICPEDKELNVVLHWARPVRGPGAATPTPAVKKMFIASADVVQVLAKNVDISEEELSGPANGSGAFETDSEISKGRGGVERELTRWQPDSSVLDPSLTLTASTFGRPNSGSVTGWDQFETNRQKFQVKSTWDENLYTTKLDKSKAGISVAEAERLAAEIERQTTRNRHMAEERGFKDLSVQEIDEEELYSSVARGEAVPMDEDRAAPAADAANDLTFGSDADSSKPASSSGRDAADGSRKAAWANAGAGVAAVSGRGGAWEPPGKVRTAPVAVVDPRKEHNKLRLQMTGGPIIKGKDRSSPSSYGTPKGLRSPLSSPLVGDSTQVEALDLNPGVARIDPKTRKEFLEFKTKKKEGSDAASDLRTFSHDLSSSGRQAPQLSSSGGSSKAGGLLSPSSAPPSNSSFSSDAPPAAPSVSAAPSAAPAAAPSSTSGAGPSSTGQPPRPPASKSSLNPDAKSFSFNPNAKEFKPLFSTSTTPAGTPFGTPAATPPATPGSSLGGAGAFRQNSFGSSHFGGPSGASQWINSQRSHSSPANHSANQRKFERQMEREGRQWGEDGARGGSLERDLARNGLGPGPGGPPPPHGGPLHPMSASAAAQMSPGSGHMGGPVGLPMGGPPGQWAAMPQQFVPGQPFIPMVPGSPQQPAMMAYMGRPYGPPPGGFLVRPGSMPGSPYGPGGMMYAPAPPGMHPGGPGGPRPPMFPGQGMMMQGGPGMGPMGMPGPQMGMPGGPGGEQSGGPGPHGSPEQRNRGGSGGHHFHSPIKP